jgi:long-chain fatty acid transport protein
MAMMRLRFATAVACLVLGTASSVLAQGFVLTGVGAINRSMGGAGTAAPLDSIGALQWNPASITAVGNRVDISVDMVSNRNTVSSTLFEGTPAELSGSTDGNTGFAPMPGIGVIYGEGDSPFTYGFSLSSIGGFFVNFPASLTNPVLTPQPTGLGGAYTRLSLLQAAPMMAAKLTDGLSIGAGPTLTIADAQMSPFALNPPDGIGFYSDAMQSRPRFGAGFQLGIFYEMEQGINLGFSFKSPQWFETFKWQSHDINGLPRELSTSFRYPMILSWGASYTGIENWTFATDLRFVDFESIPVFGDPTGFRPDGSVTGLGWRNAFVWANGVQYQLNDEWSLRAGYGYNTNPVPAAEASFNINAPGLYQHLLSFGATWQFSKSIGITGTWVHGFKNTITGPLQSPIFGGPVPLSTVDLSQEADSIILAMNVLY